MDSRYSFMRMLVSIDATAAAQKPNFHIKDDTDRI